MVTASPKDAVVAYRATPLEDIVDVNWGGAQLSAVSVDFIATMIEGFPIPFYAADDFFVMSVLTRNLPLLERTELTAPPADFVGGSFPDDSSFIDAQYSLGQVGPGDPGSGGAIYSSESPTPFNGARSVTLVVSCKLRNFADGRGFGYDIFARGVGVIKGGDEIIQTISGFAEGGENIQYTATLDLNNKTFTFE